MIFIPTTVNTRETSHRRNHHESFNTARESHKQIKGRFGEVQGQGVDDLTWIQLYKN